MTVLRRTLTITFERSVTAGVPNTMEIALTPLSEPNAPELDISLVGGTQMQTVLLANAANTVTFELVPSDSDSLDQRVLYRIAWRERYLGRQYTHDFSMPDADVNFADLGDLGAILGGETYVQWSDRGRPNGVAGLNDDGQVIDADGNIVFPFAPNTVARRWVGVVLPGSGHLGVIAHNLNTTAVVVAVYDTATQLPVDVTIQPVVDSDIVTVEFSEAPLTGQYRAVVVG